ncbi:2,3-bisphosphoglycerate-independent phosphoglycerate mutase-domain-containing protein [Paraphysoderma sedebokerense]|nr:2,3-bisphosphoglycerate-independent phosphoglycerate mutase-domain-containing protein [Paraphysoderma sedebokerense]
MAPDKKLLFFLIDGLADVSVPSLDGRTPLESAQTDWMDVLAEYGLNGLMDPVEPGLACGSDTAHMSLLGYEPRIHYRGRGAYESMGAGLDMEPGDIAFKSNFAVLDKASGIVINRRADRNFEGLGPKLCEDLDGITLPSFPNHTVAVKYATEHRCGVRVRGPNLTDTITGTDPLKDNKPLRKCEPTEDTENARMTSKLVNELSDRFYEVLTDHPINHERVSNGKQPANCILLRGCGSCIDVPSIQKLHGFKSFMIAPTCIIAGLGMTVKMDIIKVPGATAVDDAGHDKNIGLKVQFLEKIDKMIGNVIKALADKVRNGDKTEYTIVLTGDHSTPVVYGDHSYEPVPFVVATLSNILNSDKLTNDGAPTDLDSDNKRRKIGNMRIVNGKLIDSVRKFNEIETRLGGLGRFCGGEVMGIVKRYMGV